MAGCIFWVESGKELSDKLADFGSCGAKQIEELVVVCDGTGEKKFWFWGCSKDTVIISHNKSICLGHG
jgi:hypothetical protein